VRNNPLNRRSRTALLLAAGVALTALPFAQSGASAVAATNTYHAYAIPEVHSGEPSIGVDFKTGAVMTQFGLTTVRATWDDTQTPPTPKFVEVTPFTSTIESLDPILAVDRHTNRTFVDHLTGVCSLLSFSDDSGKTWTPSEGCGPGAVVDHQTVGAGPAHEPLTGLSPTYDGVVYYCAQNAYQGMCSSSLDGGLTFGPAVPAANGPLNAVDEPDPVIKAEGGACSALHGHLKVGNDGVAYLPLKGCGGEPTIENLTNTEYWGGSPSLSVSENNGLTWNIRRVPGGHNQDESDPSLGIGRGDKVPGGRLYLGWQDGTNPSAVGYGTTSAAKIAYSDDHGKTWSQPVDLSSALGLHNVQFPEVAVGDDGRAAIAFLGTNAIGNDQHVGFKGPDGNPGVWHMYIAYTYDGGKTWTTINATPGDPVQRGCIHMTGLSNKTATDDKLCDTVGQRNLLDFNDATVDKNGRFLVSYADGCDSDCIDDPETLSKRDDAYILRQTTGRGLFAEFDGATDTTGHTGGTTGGGTPSTGGTGGTGGGSGSGSGSGSGGDGLAATGLRSWPAVLGLVLVGVGFAVRRRNRAA
jgi:hypothetical protein